MLNMMTIMSLVSGAVSLGSQIGKLWESSAGFSAIAQAIMTSPALKAFEATGAELFPSVDKAIQKVLGALHVAYPQSTQWIQTALNAAQTLSYIKFGDPLAVDGKFGPKTFAAVVVLQAKLGLKTTGAVQDAEYKALNVLAAGKMP